MVMNFYILLHSKIWGLAAAQIFIPWSANISIFSECHEMSIAEKSVS